MFNYSIVIADMTYPNPNPSTNEDWLIGKWHGSNITFHIEKKDGYLWIYKDGKVKYTAWLLYNSHNDNWDVIIMGAATQQIISIINRSLIAFNTKLARRVL